MYRMTRCPFGAPQLRGLTFIRSRRRMGSRKDGYTDRRKVDGYIGIAALWVAKPVDLAGVQRKQFAARGQQEPSRRLRPLQRYATQRRARIRKRRPGIDLNRLQVRLFEQKVPVQVDLY